MEVLAESEEIGKSVTYQYSWTIVNVLSGFLFYIYIIHFFSTEVVGVVALLSAIMALFSSIFNVGLNFGVQHFISYYRGRNDPGSMRQVVRKISIALLLLSVVAFIFIWFSAPAFAFLFFHTYEYIELIRFISFAVVGTLTNSVLGGMVIGLQKFRANGLISILYTVAIYSTIIMLLQVRGIPLMVVVGWIAGYFLGTAIFSLYVYGSIKGIKEKTGSVSLRTVMSYSFPLFISSLLGYGATYVDRFIVSFFLNLSEMGIYNFSLLIITALGVLVGPFSVILLPKLSEFYGKGDLESVRFYGGKAIELLLAFYVPVALLVAAVSPSILLFLANPAYLPGYVPIIIISVLNSIFISSNILAVSLQAVRKTRLFLISSSLALVSNFLLSILLIPRYGIDGAAAGFSSIYAVAFIVTYYYSRKYETVSFEIKKIAKILLSGALMFSIIFYLQMHFWYSPLKLFAYIMTGFIIYAVLIRVLGTFNGEDVELFVKLLPKGLNVKLILKRILVR